MKTSRKERRLRMQWGLVMVFLALIGVMGGTGPANAACRENVLVIDGGTQRVEFSSGDSNGEKRGSMSLVGVGMEFGSACFAGPGPEISFGAVLDFDYARGRLDDAVLTTESWGAGPKGCLVFSTGTDLCAAGNVRATSFRHDGTRERLGSVASEISLEQRFDEFVGRLGVERAKYDSGDGGIETLGVTLGLGFRVGD